MLYEQVEKEQFGMNISEIPIPNVRYLLISIWRHLCIGSYWRQRKVENVFGIDR
jgi:hypothetical protein